MKRFRSIRNYANEKKIHDDNHKKWFFLLAELERNTLIYYKKFQRTREHIFIFFNGYKKTRRNGTKWGCQNQIKSKSKSNQKSNLKQDFKLKPVSNAFFGLFTSLFTLGSELLMWYFLFLRCTHCYKKWLWLIDLLSFPHVRDVCLFFTHWCSKHRNLKCWWKWKCKDASKDYTGIRSGTCPKNLVFSPFSHSRSSYG